MVLRGVPVISTIAKILSRHGKTRKGKATRNTINNPILTLRQRRGEISIKQSISLCKHLVETWRTMGIPKVSQMDNEIAATGGGRYTYRLSQGYSPSLAYGYSCGIHSTGRTRKKCYYLEF